MQELSGLLGDIGVGRSVEAVAADVQVFVVLIGKAVHIGLRRHGHAELRIEDGNVGSTREKILADFDAHEVGRVVKRSERDAVANDLLDLIVDKLGLGGRWRRFRSCP